MSDIKIKTEHAKRLVVFGGGGRILLGERSQQDLKILAIMALKAKDKLLLSYFDGELPSLEELQKDQTKIEIAKGPGKKPATEVNIPGRSTEQ